MATLAGSKVEQITYAEAKALIVRYEWLRTMPTVTRACYGLRTPEGELAGVAVFARGPAPESADLCGPGHRDLTICLARGACVHWAHPHAASFLISRACKLAHAEFGWKVFYAYSDPTAGELGVVYQACNWIYLGAGVGRNAGRGRWRFFNRRDGKWRSDRVLSRRRFRLAELRAHPHWIPEFTPDKGRYAWFLRAPHREKSELRRALKYEPQRYPERRAVRAVLAGSGLQEESRRRERAASGLPCSSWRPRQMTDNPSAQQYLRPMELEDTRFVAVEDPALDALLRKGQDAIVCLLRTRWTRSASSPTPARAARPGETRKSPGWVKCWQPWTSRNDLAESRRHFRRVVSTLPVSGSTSPSPARRLTGWPTRRS